MRARDPRSTQQLSSEYTGHLISDNMVLQLYICHTARIALSEPTTRNGDRRLELVSLPVEGEAYRRINEEKSLVSSTRTPMTALEGDVRKLRRCSPKKGRGQYRNIVRMYRTRILEIDSKRADGRRRRLLRDGDAQRSRIREISRESRPNISDAYWDNRDSGPVDFRTGRFEHGVPIQSSSGHRSPVRLSNRPSIPSASRY